MGRVTVNTHIIFFCLSRFYHWVEVLLSSSKLPSISSTFLLSFCSHVIQDFECFPVLTSACCDLCWRLFVVLRGQHPYFSWSSCFLDMPCEPFKFLVAVDFLGVTQYVSGYVQCSLFSTKFIYYIEKCRNSVSNIH